MSSLRNIGIACVLAACAALPTWATDELSSAPGGPPGSSGPPPRAGRGPGPGMMGGYGPGMPGGYGPGMMGGYGPGGMMGGYGPGARGGYGPGMFGFGDEAQMVEFVDGRLAFLKAELKITDRQMPQWNSFADAVRANARNLNARRMPFFMHDWAQKSLPERLDREEAALAARLDAFRSTSAALKPLYAVLDDAQKKAADELLMTPMGGGRGVL